MGSTHTAKVFTESLLSVIRQQRHFGTRIIISTQEPTISPKLLDLSSLTIIHRFTSPEWYQTIKKHIHTGDMFDDDEESEKHKRGSSTGLLRQISALDTGEALVFAPAAVLNIKHDGTLERMSGRRMKMRGRVTYDGGRSIVSV